MKFKLKGNISSKCKGKTFNKKIKSGLIEGKKYKIEHYSLDFKQIIIFYTEEF